MAVGVELSVDTVDTKDTEVTEDTAEVIEEDSVGEPADADGRKPSETVTDYGEDTQQTTKVIEKAGIGEPTEADSRKSSGTRTAYSDVTMETTEIMEKAGIQEPGLSANAANGRNALTTPMDGSVVVSGAAKIPVTLDFIPSVEKLRRNRGKIVRDRRPVTRSTSRLP
ncbi:unnamed protein product [Zymoseptoria tritici ST99CH_3D1]|nr:unnamed protein product [Zymoseptoria tritici ST99CH_3D1]